jgi:hypothetical protein
MEVDSAPEVFHRNERQNSCPILTLPYELLEQILSYVLENPIYPSHIPTCELTLWDLTSPILICRSVCRRIRMITNQVHWWQPESFNFLILYPGVIRKNKSTVAWLKALFADSHLVQCLSQKTHWRITGLWYLHAVLHGVPSFRQTAESISLAWFDKDVLLNRAIKKLTSCSRLTTLVLRSFDISATGALEPISHSCPSIENLVLRGNLESFRGTLDGLSKIRRLKLMLHHFPPSPTLDFVPLHLFPLASAELLTNLELKIVPQLEDPYDVAALHNFENVTSLSISPLSPRLCEFIIRSRMRLVTFNVWVSCNSEISETMLEDMFSATSLRTVENLELRLPSLFDIDETFIDIYDTDLLIDETEPAIQAITTNMQHLQYLDFDMGLDIRWCREFAQLSMLKELIWTVRYANKSFLSLQHPDDDNRLPPDVEAERAFLAAFAEFPETPKVQIKLKYKKSARPSDLPNSGEETREDGLQEEEVAEEQSDSEEDMHGEELDDEQLHAGMELEEEQL